MNKDDEDDNPPYGHRYTKRERRLFAALQDIAPQANDAQLVEVIESLTDLIGAKIDDLDDKVHQRGMYDPDW